MKTYTIFLTAILGTVVSANLALPAAAESFDVNVEPYTLYADPNTGNEVKLGGFSGLYPVAGDPSRFYVVSDRGPSYDYIVQDAEGVEDDLEYSVFLSPQFGPHIMTIHLLAGGTAEVENIMPLVRGDGSIVSGLPNSAPTGLVDVNLEPLEEADADGLDTEGLTIDTQGNFWVSEEYRPSVAMVSRGGEVLLRLVPEGSLTGEEQVPTFDILPGILSKRVNNRGLEGVTAARDGTLYAVMQRPLANPNKAVSEASRNIRLLAINLKALRAGHTEGIVRQLIYRTELVHRSDYAADLFAITPSVLLVPERRADKLFVINVAGATDITGYEDADGNLLSDPTKTIEMLDAAGLAALGIKPVQKAVILDSLTAIDPALSKCEGACLVGDSIVLTADNDFNVDATVVLDTDPVILPIPVYLQDPTNLPRIHVVPFPHGQVVVE